MMFYIVMIVFSPVTAIIPGIYATYLIFKKKATVERNYLNITLFIFFCWSIIVAILNNSLLSLGGAFLVLMYFSVGVVSQNYFTSRDKIINVLKLLMYLSTLTAINGIIEVTVHKILGHNHYRLISAYGNANMAGAWFGITIIIGLYLRSISKDKKENRIYIFCLVALIIAFFLTESSGAFVAFLAAVVSYYTLKYINSMKRMLLTIIIVVGFAFVFTAIQTKGKPQAVVVEVSNSFNSRYDIWNGSMEMFVKKPLMGWGTLATLEHGNTYFERNGNSIHSHNIYLTFMVTTGLIGLSMYLFIKYKLFKNLYYLFRKRESLLPLLVAINMMVIVQGLVDCSLYAPQLGILFVGSSSIAVNLANNKVLKSNKKASKKVIAFESKTMII